MYLHNVFFFCFFCRCCSTIQLHAERILHSSASFYVVINFFSMQERENRRARKKMQSKMAKSMKVRATA